MGFSPTFNLYNLGYKFLICSKSDPDKLFCLISRTSRVSILGKLARDLSPNPFKDKWSKLSYNSKVCLWSSVNSVMLLKSSSKTNSSI